MPLPTAITDLSITAASNYPAGSDSPSTLDDVQRAHAAFIAQLRDGNGSVPEIDIASGATVNIGAAASPYLRVTGTTGITSLGTNYKGIKFLRFAGALTITHNATSLICPNSANVATVAGDVYCAYPKATAGVGDGWVLVPLYAESPVTVYAYNSAATSIPASAYTKVDFQTEETDTAGVFASSRLTATVAGDYLISASCTILAATGLLATAIYKNGALRRASSNVDSSLTQQLAAGIGTLVYLGVGDYVEIYVYQQSGSAQNTITGAANTWFSATLLQRR